MYGNVSGQFTIPSTIQVARIIDITGSIQETSTSPIYPLNYFNPSTNVYFRAYINGSNLHVESSFNYMIYRMTLIITYIK
jgi:hypothetical protein